ncbi:hypothetical protein SNEBB_007561 [Seison nebaliae]|nr:hypothetical protein SNEBB_007561 [Seison nebaliae]
MDDIFIDQLPLENVTIYTSSAEIKKVYTSKILEKGITKIRFGKFPERCDINSTKIEGRGAATINEVTLKKDYLSEEEYAKIDGAISEVDRTEIDKKIKDLKLVIDNLLCKGNEVEEKINRLSTSKKIVDSYRDNLNKIPPSGTFPLIAMKSNEYNTLGNLKEFLEFQEDFLNTYSKEMKSAKDEKKMISDELHVNEKRRERLKKGKKIVYKSANVILDVKSEGSVQLFITYQVNDACWESEYDIRVNSEEQAMKIEYRAIIQQHTGEDWKNAKIILSTSKPTLGLSGLPMLNPQTIGIDIPKRKISPMLYGMASNHSKEFGFDDYLSPSPFEGGASANEASLHEASPHMEVKEMEVVQGEFGGTAAQFFIEHKTDIPSDYEDHKVSIAVLNLTAQFYYEATPKISLSAFLKSLVTNNTEYPLLAGSASIYLDNSFISTTMLETLNAGEKLSISLGIDESIVIKYPTKRIHKSSNGLVYKNMIEKNKQDIFISNKFKKSIRMVVSDQIPISGDEKIKVHLIEPKLDLNKRHSVGRDEITEEHDDIFTGKDSETINSNNILRWVLNIPGNSKKSVSMEYTLEYPIDSKVKIT